MLINFLNYLGDPNLLIAWGGLAILLVIIYLETGFFVGLVLPGGDYLVFTAGVLCGTAYLPVPLGWLVTAMITAAILGDFTGYAKGMWLGPKLFDKEENRFFKPSHIEKTRDFYSRYGLLAFILGRFMPVVRTLIPMLAGASDFPKGRFVLVNILGAIVWIGTLVPAGYFIGKEYPQIIQYKIYILIAFVLIASLPALKILLNSSKS